MKPLATSALAVIGLGTGFAVTAQEPDLRAQISALQERVEQLESDDAATMQSPGRISLSGDLRYRHEMIDDANAATDRNRHRIRARVKLSADLGNDLSAGIALGTGGDNPISGNQTLGDGFSTKDIGIDRAFFSWDINETLNLTGGKMANPWFRPGGSHLIFDGDLNPEGLALEYDSGDVFAMISGQWVGERGSSEDDAILYAAQGGYRTTLGDDVALTVGGGYLNYSHVRGYLPPHFESGRGNSVDGGENLIHDYDILELFAEAQFSLGEQPMRVFVDLVENLEANSMERGYSLGFRWRRAQAPGSWDASWAYQELEADAVLASFTDSDFAGGGTDSKGHVFRSSYVLRDNVRLNGSYFMNQRGEAAGNERDYDRLQLDISFLF